jgi:hypothetical protein
MEANQIPPPALPKLEPVQIVQGLQPFNEKRREEHVIDPRPVADRPILALRNLATTQEFVFFTLAPLYCALAIPFDVVSQFAATEWGKDAELKKLSAPQRIIEDIPGWEDVLETINREHWPKLVEFMGELMFQRLSSYWAVCGDFVQVPMNGVPVQIAVFTPRSLGERMKPWVNERGIIRFSLEKTTDAFEHSDYTRKLNLFLKEQ